MSNSTKPYLIRSIYDWCIDNDFTPYISVKIYSGLDIPMQYVKNDEIVFNIGIKAAHDLIINNHNIRFMARFNSIPRQLEIPIHAVKGIFAKEVNQGLTFPVDDKEDGDQSALSNEDGSILSKSLTCHEKNLSKPNLRVIK
ncbi:MAG: ClpXP protease specificity-enhancing factor [Nitrosomonas sp.]